MGERDRSKLRRLALEERKQPGRCLGASSINLLDHGGGADHQSLAQRLVAGTRDHTEPLLAGGRVILGGEPDPSRKISPTSKRLRIRALSVPVPTLVPFAARAFTSVGTKGTLA